MQSPFGDNPVDFSEAIGPRAPKKKLNKPPSARRNKRNAAWGLHLSTIPATSDQITALFRANLSDIIQLSQDVTVSGVTLTFNTDGLYLVNYMSFYEGAGGDDFRVYPNIAGQTRGVLNYSRDTTSHATPVTSLVQVSAGDTMDISFEIVGATTLYRLLDVAGWNEIHIARIA